MSDQRGNALLAATVTVLVAAIVLLVAVHVGVLLRTRAVAAAAADHAALAVAGTLGGGSGDPAVAAARVARGFGARVTACACRDLPVRVEVAAPVPNRLPILARVVGPNVTATGHARLVPVEHR